MGARWDSDPVLAHSREMIRRGSKSFAAAARLFDGRIRESACMLYAWCRYCDDEIDGQSHGHGMDDQAAGGRRGLERLYRETRRALAGEGVDEPAFLALQRVVQDHDIPERYPLELLEGFAMDVDGRSYVELEDTLLYCYHVAGVVGVMMAYVMGVRDQETLHRAADLGIALQLTNIARDVIEDAGCGRVYLPARWLSEQGISTAQVAEPRHRAQVALVVRRLLDEAERYYTSANQGLPRLCFRSAWAVATARGVYRDIGRAALARGAHAWDERVVVSGNRKVLRGLQGAWDALLAVSLGRLVQCSPRTGLWTKPDPSSAPAQSNQFKNPGPLLRRNR